MHDRKHELNPRVVATILILLYFKGRNSKVLTPCVHQPRSLAAQGCERLRESRIKLLPTAKHTCVQIVLSFSSANKLRQPLKAYLRKRKMLFMPNLI